MPDARIPPADEPASHPDDLDIEVSDMRRQPQPGGAPEDGNGRTPWYRQRVQVPRPLVVATLIVLLGLILLVAPPIGSALRALIPQPTPTTAIVQVVYPTAPLATATPSPFPTPTLITPAIGSVPASCPPSTRLVDFAPTATIPGVGGSDIWMVGLVGPGGYPIAGQRATAKIGAPSRIIVSYTPYGWPFGIMVLARSDFAETVTITGQDLRTGHDLWFSPEANARNTAVETAPILTIDFSQPAAGSSDGQWKIWFGVLYLPGAGCYTLQANWPGGGWVANFAAGR